MTATRASGKASCRRGGRYEREQSRFPHSGRGPSGDPNAGFVSVPGPFVAQVSLVNFEESVSPTPTLTGDETP